MKNIIYIIAAVLSISFANQAQAQVVTPAEVITLTANLNTRQGYIIQFEGGN